MDFPIDEDIISIEIENFQYSDLNIIDNDSLMLCSKEYEDESLKLLKSVDSDLEKNDFIECIDISSSSSADKDDEIDENQSELDLDFDKRLILDFDTKQNQVLVEVDLNLLKILKPHQIEGIKFMFDSTIGSVNRLLNQNYQSGCILAHSMGLGKTLQVITLLYTVMSNKYCSEKIKRVLIIVPLNVALNWSEEWRKWPKKCQNYRPIPLFEMLKIKKLEDRLSLLARWYQTGGIMICTIHLISNLINHTNFKPHQVEKFHLFEKYLLKPGPDILVVDEGHLLKNHQTLLNRSISRISTLRRIVLTGTPLQNNLTEYFVMVDFIKPGLLSTKANFMRKYANPIKKGLYIDSDRQQIQEMKRKIYVLYQIVGPYIHRCDSTILYQYLKPKHEYVVTVRLTDCQNQLYRYFFDNIVDYKQHKNLLYDFNLLMLLCNHPFLMVNFCEKNSQKLNQTDNGTETLSHKIIDLTTTTTEIDWPSENNRINQKSNWQGWAEMKWWKKFLPENLDQLQTLELSSKMMVMFFIVDQCQLIGDKLLIFSQSLETLDLIEYLFQSQRNLTKRKHYFRIDGSVQPQARQNIIQTFNDFENSQARLLLISIRAGGIGVNLVGANRAILFDCSWNPSNDQQAIFRIFRYGQMKPVFVYRLLAFGTMEHTIYERQVTKQSVSKRVCDKQQIDQHFTRADIEDFYVNNKLFDRKIYQTHIFPEDSVLANLLSKQKDWIVSYHEHDSFLVNQPGEHLTDSEMKAAWKEYQNSNFKNSY